jgi:hypothetical protein
VRQHAVDTVDVAACCGHRHVDTPYPEAVLLYVLQSWWGRNSVTLTHVAVFQHVNLYVIMVPLAGS